jgi:cell division protein FtsQ
VVSLALVLLAAFGVAWVYAGMVTHDQWPIRWLELDGRFQRVSAEQLRANLAPLVAGSYFTVGLGEVRDAAYRQPWVARVTVQKHWPDTVRVSVTEHVPVAHWTSNRLVSAAGESFEVPGADAIQGLPWLQGPKHSLPEVFAAWQKFNDILMAAGLEIDRIRLDPRGAWFLALTNGTEVHIGRGDAEARLRRLVTSWEALTGRRPGVPADVDLRYTNGFAVRWPEQDENHGKES